MKDVSRQQDNNVQGGYINVQPHYVIMRYMKIMNHKPKNETNNLCGTITLSVGHIINHFLASIRRSKMLLPKNAVKLQYVSLKHDYATYTHTIIHEKPL